MIRVKFYSKNIGVEMDMWLEDAMVNSMKTAEKEIRAIIEEFNRTEKIICGDKARLREFVRLANEAGVNQHEWQKIDVYSGSTTRYKCQKCWLVREVHGFTRPIGGACHPKRVCIACNKEFKSGKNRDRHIAKMHPEAG